MKNNYNKGIAPLFIVLALLIVGAVGAGIYAGVARDEVGDATSETRENAENVEVAEIDASPAATSEAQVVEPKAEVKAETNVTAKVEPNVITPVVAKPVVISSGHGISDAEVFGIQISSRDAIHDPRDLRCYRPAIFGGKGTAARMDEVRYFSQGRYRVDDYIGGKLASVNIGSKEYTLAPELVVGQTERSYNFMRWIRNEDNYPVRYAYVIYVSGKATIPCQVYDVKESLFSEPTGVELIVKPDNGIVETGGNNCRGDMCLFDQSHTPNINEGDIW